MATTCAFGQIKDLRLTSLCMGDVQIINKTGEITGKNITSNGNITSKHNLIVSGNATIGGNVVISSDLEVCGNLVYAHDPVSENNTKTIRHIDNLFVVTPSEPTIMQWTDTEYDYNAHWDGNSIINITESGVYHIEATIDWSEGASQVSTRNMFTVINGNIKGSAAITQCIGDSPIIQNCSCDISLYKGDKVQLQVYHDDSQPINIGYLGLANLSVRYVHKLITSKPLCFVNLNLSDLAIHKRQTRVRKQLHKPFGRMG